LGRNPTPRYLIRTPAGLHLNALS